MLVASLQVSAISGKNAESRTDLDSHANMPVVGSEAYILAELGITCEVCPFTPDYDPLKVPMVDAAIRYDSPFEDEVYILVLRNALYVPSMNYNLIPPFMLREAGIIVKETPKFQLDDPTEEDHAITFPDTGFRIPLSLTGTFSYFPTSKPTLDDLTEPKEVYMLTPTTWNPHLDAYAKHEESMLDWEGNIKAKHDRPMRIVLDDIPMEQTETDTFMISSLESLQIDKLMIDDTQADCQKDPLLHALLSRAEKGDFMMSIGSTYAADQSELVAETAALDESDEGSLENPVDESEHSLNSEEIESELDDFMASVVSGFEHGITPEHLSKVWRISIDG